MLAVNYSLNHLLRLDLGNSNNPLLVKATGYDQNKLLTLFRDMNKRFESNNTVFDMKYANIWKSFTKGKQY